MKQKDSVAKLGISALQGGEDVKICVGDVCGTVSSDHLTVPKINQLWAAWFRKQSKVGS